MNDMKFAATGDAFITQRLPRDTARCKSHPSDSPRQDPPVVPRYKDSPTRFPNLPNRRDW
jgi:hypothetical protein